MFNRQKSFTKL